MNRITVSSSIRRLPESLANQIAAGEVIERPASVVKELMENSLDAGATQIRVELDKGGMTRVEVSDDGNGIAAEELPLAVAAHATSKLDALDTLMRIATLGFRGEALASICAVSRWQLSSCEAGSEHAWQLAHDQAQVQPAAHPQGTRMRVADLFYNVPARRKFLRAEQTEYRHVETVFRRLALSHFDVGFTLSHNGRVAQRLAAAGDEIGQARRVRKLCGKAFLDNALELDLGWQGMRLHGWLGRHDYSRPQGDSQYFYINGRIIRDRIINHAIRQAYQSHLYPGRFPAYVLYLELPFEEVDVNVHPTKHEVRFHQARQVHDFLSRALREALYPDPHGELLSQLPAYEDRYHRPPARGPHGEALAEANETYQTNVVVDEEQNAGPATAWFDECVARLFGRYALLRSGSRCWLCDLPRAMAKHTEMKLRQAIGEGALASLPLLMPASLVLNPDQMTALECHCEPLQRFGFDYTATGPSAVMIRSIPAMLSKRLELASLLPALLTQLDGAAQAQADDIVIAQISEHAGQWTGEMTLEQIDGLLRDIQDNGAAVDTVLREMSEADLQRLFERAGS